MMTVNDRLTSWIQMQQGSLSLHVKRFSLNDVLHVIAMQQYAFAQQQLTLEVPETDLIVRADKALTLFMVNTLVDNARKFTPSGGLVSVRLDSTDAYVEVSVCDTGIGLSQEDVQALCDSKVYDPNSIGVTDAGKGFGFGIMNCKGIIGSYRKLSSLFNVCDFGVESEQGSGSRFWFRLPRVLPVLFFLLSHLALQAMPQRCYELYDSAFAANVDGRYADAYLLCENALQQTEAPVDTPLLVSLYNEQAIAAQTLGDWEAYRRSNAECVRLHRLYSTDGTLASDCLRLEKMNSNSRVLYVLMVLLLIASLALFYRVVLRHRLRHHASLDVLYQRLLSVLQTFPENTTSIEDELQEVAHSLEHPQQKKSVQELLQILSEGLERVKEAETAIRETEETEQRWRFEHDRLYVMNQILDNSLSTIKHETMYFPSRIKQMADDMQQKGFDAVTQRNLLDLVTYYRHIYMLLYEQAQRQTDQSPLCIQNIALDEVIAEKSKNGVTYSDTGLCLRGDKTLLRLFFKQLIAIAPSGVSIDAECRAGMVYVICTVEGEHLSSEQLSGLFSPQTGRIECLVMRQIIHELDAACSHPGLRLVADDTKTGYSISFSLLASGKPKH
jgi:signal transduction histidine kinase